MIRGCLNLGSDALYTQGNNVMEILDGPQLTKCNDTAIVNARAAVTPGFDEWENPWGGIDRIQPEDWVDLYFHNEKNWPKFRDVRNLPLTHHQVGAGPPYQPERIPQYHRLALREIFNLGAAFSFGATFGLVSGLVSTGVAVILCLKSPGHFITAVVYDDVKQIIGFRDPAPVKWKQETIDLQGIKWFGVSDWSNVQDNYTKCWRI